MKKTAITAVLIVLGLVALLPATTINAIRDFIQVSAPSNPPAGQSRVFVSSSTHQLSCLNSDGSSCAGGVSVMAPTVTYPVAASYAWVNQGGASVVGGSSSPMLMTVPGSASDSLRIQEINLPATPYTLDVCLDITYDNANFAWAGISVRDSTAGTVQTFGVSHQDSTSPALTGNQLSIDNWNSVTSYNATPATFFKSWNTSSVNIRCLRLNDTGTNFVFSSSFDGFNWIQLSSTSRTAFLAAPDKLGFFGNSRNSSPVYVDLWSWLIH